MTTSTTALVAASMLGGCFIEQLPSYDDDGSGMMGTRPAIQSLAIGDSTSCAVLTNRTVRCWGNALEGIGTYGNRTLRPVAVSGLGTNVEALALTTSHGCVLGAAAVQCFGTNDQGQIGNGTMDPSMRLALTSAMGATDAVQLSLVQSRSAVRTSGGAVLAWGAGFVGFGAVVPTAVAGITGATYLSLGDSHNCAVTGGSVMCWGWNHNGQLGRGSVPTTPAVEQPAPVVNITDATQVLTGDPTCVLHAGGTVSCWGLTTPTPGTPTPVAGLSGVKTLIGGSQYVCALMTTGTVACWGDNTIGQLGLGMGVPSTTTPTMIPALTDIVELAGSATSVCARAGNGDVWCWGANVPGDGSMMGSAIPALVRW